MIKSFFLLFIVSFASVMCYAKQTNPVVIKIDGKPIYKSELIEAYKTSLSSGSAVNDKSFEDFVQSYIDFKLNIAEAKALGLDTTALFKRDYNSYKMQLSDSYLVDTIGDAAYMRHIFKRFYEDVEINHVLLPYTQKEVLPADTLKLYAEALSLRQELLEKGFTGNQFKNISSVTSILSSVETVNGYLGWIKPLMLSLSVENAAYELPIKAISMPIRTDKGYHIIQVLNRRPAQGPVRVEQVVFNFPTIPASQQDIDSVGKFIRKEMANIRTAADFQSLCDEFSQAYQTGSQGCEFGIVGLDSKLPFSFISAALNLKKAGDISDAILTDYGYHIIRLKERIDVPTLAVIEQSFPKSKIPADRMKRLDVQKTERLSKTFNLNLDVATYRKLEMLANSISPLDSTFIEKITDRDAVLLTIDKKKTYYVSDFLSFIEARIELIRPEQDDIRILQEIGNVKYSLSTDNLADLLHMFAHAKLTNYAKLTLEDRFPKFGADMNVFAEGILLFTVKNENVWQKSANDQAGLKAYFETNRSKYTLGEKKYKGLIVYSKTEEALKKAETLSQQNSDRNEIIKQLRSQFNTDSVVVQFEVGLWAKGDNTFVDNKVYGGTAPLTRKGFPHFFVLGRFIDAPEEYEDVKNEVINDYQQQLEADWSAYLQRKYKVEIDRAVLNTIQ